MALGMLFLLTIREPGRREPASSSSRYSGLGPALASLGRQRSYVWIVIAGSIANISVSAHLIWGATFLVRVHRFSLVEVANVVGPVRGVLTLAGGLVAGLLVQRLARRDARWRVWLPGLCCALTSPAQFLFLFGDTVPLAVAGLAMESLLGGMLVPLIYAVLLDIAPARMRALAASIYILTLSIFGQVVGPALVGIVNDILAGRHGHFAIRYSMAVAACFGAVSGLVFLIASRRYSADAARASTE